MKKHCQFCGAHEGHLVPLSPTAYFCIRCGKMHDDFRLDGIFDNKAPSNPADAVEAESVVDRTAPIGQEDKERTAKVKQKGVSAEL